MDYSQEELLAEVSRKQAGAIWDILGITLVTAEKERIVATMPIETVHRQPFGYLHGGISVTLAESLASLGSLLHIDRERQMAFGLEINANHVRPKRDGQLTGVATPVHIGRTTHIWEIRISDEAGKLVCISRCTVAVVDRPPQDGTAPR